jgi:hypothetical protein
LHIHTLWLWLFKPNTIERNLNTTSGQLGVYPDEVSLKEQQKKTREVLLFSLDVKYNVVGEIDQW